MLIRFVCPAGHKIKAESRFAGQSSHCPACGSAVVVPAAPDPITPDPITETGALRILNECRTDAEPVAAPAAPSPTKPCPRCNATLSRSARICWSCRLDVGPTLDAWKSALRAAVRHVKGRRAS